MGSILSPAPIDNRVEKVMKKFSISKGKIQELWIIFCRHCQEINGEPVLLVIILLEDILHYPPSPLTDALPVFFETTVESYLYFREFVEIVCQFCFFEQIDLLKYIFNVLDAGKLGKIEKKVFKHFFYAIWRHKPYDNLREAMEYLEKIDDSGNYTFKQFLDLRNIYPMIFYPMYAFQGAMIAHTFGEFWWTHHKAFYLDDLKRKKRKEEQRLKLLERQKDRERARNENIEEEMVRQRMGILFYLTPWRRILERQRIAKIAAWEDELDRMVDEMEVRKEKIVRLAALSKNDQSFSSI